MIPFNYTKENYNDELFKNVQNIIKFDIQKKICVYYIYNNY